jgi:hypothetical protein
MPLWQDKLFIFLLKNAANPTDFYHIPPGRVVEMGAQVTGLREPRSPPASACMTETLTGAVPDELEEAVDRLLAAACDKELSLVTAESCTGGLLASILTDVSGKAHAFERGFVTYTNDAKAEMLGVDRALLDDPGPCRSPWRGRWRKARSRIAAATWLYR